MTELEFVAWYVSGLVAVFCGAFVWGHYSHMIKKLGTSA